jgi:hypothetical protein
MGAAEARRLSLLHQRPCHRVHVLLPQLPRCPLQRHGHAWSTPGRCLGARTCPAPASLAPAPAHRRPSLARQLTTACLPRTTTVLPVGSLDKRRHCNCIIEHLTASLGSGCRPHPSAEQPLRAAATTHVCTRTVVPRHRLVGAHGLLVWMLSKPAPLLA